MDIPGALLVCDPPNAVLILMLLAGDHAGGDVKSSRL
jgi:hypothetical protein